MPEGDTVHKVAAVLRQGLVGRPVREAFVRDYPAADLRGFDVLSVEAIGKHCLIAMGPYVLRVHLGMHGSWHVNPKRDGEIMLAVEVDRYVCIGPMEMELTRGAPQLKQLGPDLLGAEEPDWDVVMERARRFCAPELAVSEVLLDQRVGCGLGNVYKSEICFLGPLQEDAFKPGVGVHPLRAWTRCATLAMLQRGRLLLQANLGGWHRTTRYDARKVKNQPGPRVWVYGRTARPCFLCRTPILGDHTGDQARTTQWCPRCQV